jgi:hypothetical protein
MPVKGLAVIVIEHRFRQLLPEPPGLDHFLIQPIDQPRKIGAILTKRTTIEELEQHL